MSTQNGTPAGTPALERNAIGLGGALTMALAFMAPAMSLFFTTPSMAGETGATVPLAYIVAMVGILCTGNALAQFSRRFPSSGSFVTYTSKGLGGRVGIVAAVVLLTGYTLAASTVIDIFGSWTHDVFVRHFSLDIPWQVLSVAAAVVLTAMAVRGLRLSVKGAVVMFAFEVLVIVAVAVAVLVHGGAEGLSGLPFSPGNVKLGASSGFGLAAVLAVYSFIGYEGGVALAEETNNPRRNTPLTVLISTLLLGGVYVLVTYSAVIGYGVHHLSALAGDSAPFDTLAQRYLGGSVILIGIAGITSTAGCALALLNVQPRIFYNVGRAGLLPGIMGRTHRRFRTPYVAIIVFSTLITAIPLLANWAGMDPLTIFGVIGTYGGVPVTMIYALVNLALIVYWLRHGRSGNPLTHLAIPALGVAVWIWPLYLAIKPSGSYFDWTWLFAVVPVVAGLAYLASLALARTRNAAEIAAVLAGEAEANPESYEAPQVQVAPQPTQV